MTMVRLDTNACKPLSFNWTTDQLSWTLLIYITLVFKILVIYSGVGDFVVGYGHMLVG